MCYISKNRHKFYLKCHLIFVCKYRKQLLVSDIREHVLTIFNEVENEYDFDIDIMETDKDHIHLLINYPPNISVTSIVRKLKQISTKRLWDKFRSILSKHFWSEHTFWSDGYFVCSIGEANPDTIKKYIENQG
jgi:putative transposase